MAQSRGIHAQGSIHIGQKAEAKVKKDQGNVKTIKEQESIPVGCVRPACRSYTVVCHVFRGEEG